MSEKQAGQLASAADVQKFMAGGDFPMNKKEVVLHAKNNNAPEEVLRVLNDLPGGQYDDAAAIARGLGATARGESEYTEPVKTLEEGDIFFFYRPRVEEEHPSNESDVQRLYVVLHPKDQRRYRLAIMGKQQLPDPDQRGRPFFGFIDVSAEAPDQLRDALQGERYETKTRGEQHQPGARPAGEGVYRIVGHEDHTHLIYCLELPEEEGSVQERLKIAPEASFIVSIRNPQRGQPNAPGLKQERQADYPKDLQEQFRERKFADADPPRFLDYEGCEFLLTSASGDISEELGIDLDAEKESQSSAEVFRELELERKQTTRKPLLEGEWK